VSTNAQCIQTADFCHRDRTGSRSGQNRASDTEAAGKMLKLDSMENYDKGRTFDIISSKFQIPNDAIKRGATYPHWGVGGVLI